MGESHKTDTVNIKTMFDFLLLNVHTMVFKTTRLTVLNVVLTLEEKITLEDFHVHIH